MLRKEDCTASPRCWTNTGDQQCPSLQPGSTKDVQRMAFSLPQHHLGNTETVPQKSVQISVTSGEKLSLSLPNIPSGQPCGQRSCMWQGVGTG